MSTETVPANPGEGVPNNPQPSTNPGTQSPAPPPAPSSPAPQPNSTPTQPNDQLLVAINALPERIVSSVREALTPPRPANPAPASPASPAAAVPGKKSFVDWWFGK